MTNYRKPLILIFQLLCLSYYTSAQNRHVNYLLDSFTIVINDTKIDSTGYLVNVGYMVSGANGDKLGYLVKTDRVGNVLWSKTGILGSREFRKLIIAKNGDYIILEDRPYLVMRMDKNGNPKWQQGYSFYSTWAGGIGDITELPNGNLAICGTNHFGSSSKYVGTLVMMDSVGNKIFGRSYGGALMQRTDVNHFYGITATDSNILIVGRQYRINTNVKEGGLLVVTDFNGDVVNTYLLDKTPHASGPDSLYEPLFSDVTVKNGKIYVNGSITAYRKNSLFNRVWQLFGMVDTSTKRFSGYTVYPGNDDYVMDPVMFVTDSNKYIISLSSKSTLVSPVKKRYFLAGIANDSVEYVKKVETDSTVTVKRLNVLMDTIVVTGNINTIQKQGYFFYYKQNSVNVKGCSLSDSVINLDTLNRELINPYQGTAIPVTSWSTFALYHDTLKNGMVYERQVCGDTICSPIFKVKIDTISSTVVCEGDSVILNAHTKHYKTWLRNGVPLAGGGDTLVATVSGNYKIVITNYLQCRDSDSVFVTVHTSPRPLIYSNFDTLSTDTKYYSYQWLNSIGDIPGATNPQYVPGYTDSFAVRVTDSNGCIGVSSYSWHIPLHVTSSNTSGLKVYPNPVSAGAVFYIENPTSKAFTTELFDITGRFVKSVYVSAGNNAYPLHVELPGGIYTVRLSNAIGVWNYKLVVQ